MKIREALSRYLFLPVGKTYSRRNYFKALQYKRFLEATQYWEHFKLEALRNRQFRAMVSHCYENVRFYRQYMDEKNLSPNDFQAVQDISKLPILSRKMVNENQMALTARNYNKSSIRYETTGGTTGTPTHFGRDLRNEYRVDGNNWRFWEYAGYLRGMEVALFWGNELELMKSRDIREKLKLLMENTRILNFYDLTEERLIKYVKYIDDCKPEVIRGFSTGIHLFLRYCKENNIHFRSKPKCIILTSDKIYTHEKKEITDFFDCEVFDEYGCREFSIMAHECSAHQGLHLAEELFIFEVLDPASGQSTLEGNGEIIVTPLFNYAMPLLRYRLGDKVTISRKRCTCGRNLKMISNIEGRIADFVITKSGKFIYGDFFAHLFYSSQGISMYQVQQYEKGKVIINVVKNKNFSEIEMERLMSKLRTMLRDDLAATLHYVNKIRVSGSGKRRSVISHIANQCLPK